MSGHPAGPSRGAFLSATAALAVTIAPRRGNAQGGPVHLRIGTGTVEANAQIFYAADNGFFKKNGLDVEVVKLRSGTTTMAAIVAGDLQCGVANVLSLGAAHQRNVPFVMFAPGAYFDAQVPTTLMVAAPDSTVKGPKDLAGKAAAVISVGGLDQLALDAWVDAAGVDPSQVKALEVPPSAMADALAQGRIACAVMNDPELSQAVEAKKVRVVANGYEAIAKLFMQTAWVATSDWLAKNKDLARRISASLVAGGAWGMAPGNAAAAAAILAKYTGSTESKPKIRFADKMDPALVQPVFDSAAKFKLLAAPVRAADFTWDGK